MIYTSNVSQWLKKNLIAKDSELYDLAFADPPFGIGQKYHGFKDKIESYFYFMKEWFWPAWHHVRPGGVFVLHGSSRLVTTEYMPLLIDEGMLENIEAEICWYFSFCQNRDTNWPDAFCRALVLRKEGDPKIWRPDAVTVKSERLKMGDKRIESSKRKGWVVPNNVWQGEGLCRVQGNNRERWDKKHGAMVDHPNQLPQEYLRRFVEAYTAPGGRVLDLFCGSGTMPLVCRVKGRHCDSIELCEETAESAKLRVAKGYVAI